MAKTSGGVRGGSSSGGSVLGLYTHKNGKREYGYDSVQLKYTGKGNEYGVVGLSDNGNYWIRMGGIKGSTGNVPILRKEFKTEKAVLAFAKKHGFVPDKK